MSARISPYIRKQSAESQEGFKTFWWSFRSDLQLKFHVSEPLSMVLSLTCFMFVGRKRSEELLLRWNIARPQLVPTGKWSWSSFLSRTGFLVYLIIHSAGLLICQHIAYKTCGQKGRMFAVYLSLGPLIVPLSW